jgi:iron complex outermembrane recepter protein
MSRTSLIAVAAILGAAAAPAAGQVASTEPAASEADSDIVVTARKREEKLADVPLTISVVGAEAIDRANLVNVSDLANQTPGFSYKQGFGRTGGGGGAGVRPSIRGMSSVVGAPNAAFFVDGVFVSDNIASYALDNLERVEVIKGPQSALFGRQTFSGAINYVTRKPTNEWTGRAKATLAEYANVELSGFLSGPIVKDVLLFEVNARNYSFGGDYVNADNGRRELGAQSSTNVGGRILFKPGTNFEAIATIGYSEDRDRGYIYGFQGSARNNCFAPPLSGSQIPFPRTATSRRGFFCGEIGVLPSYAYNNDAIEAAGYAGLIRKFLRTSLSMTYTTDSGFSFTSVTAYNRNNSITGQDNTLLPSANPAFAIDQSRTTDWSQEIRIQSPADRPVRVLAGGYYYRDDTQAGFSATNTNLSQRPFDSADGVRSKSVFGMIEADIGAFTASAEARYQDETVLGSTEVLGTAGAPPPAPTGLREARFTAFLPRFTARYQVSPSLNLYATAAKGNKPGGFNNFPTDAIAADIAAFTAAGFDVFREESAWSFEIGAKGNVGPVNFAVSAFYIDWQNQQLSRGESYTRTNGTPNSVVFIQNAGQSRIKGFEFDLSGRPAPWLFLRAAYAYVDARFVRFYDDTTEEIYDTDGRPSFIRGVRNPLDVDGPTGDLSGRFLPQTPQHQATFTAQVDVPVWQDWEFTGRGDLAYESKRFSQVDNLNWAGDSFNLNASLGLQNGRLSFSVFARNLLDDKTPLVVTRLLDFNRPLNRINPLTGLAGVSFFRDFAVSAPRRRQFGVTMGVKF